MLIGIIGTSEIALQHAFAAQNLGHRIIFANSGNTKSPNTINCRNIFPECQQVNLNTLLYKSDCDLIISCLPVTLVDYYFNQLYDYVKPILFEKPPYINISTNLAQLEQSNQHRIGFNKRFFTSVEVLKNKVLQDAPIQVDIKISEASMSHKYDLISARKLNYLYYSSSSHLLDLALYLFGTYSKVNFRNVRDNSNNHFGYVGNMEFSNGIFATVSILIDDPVRIGISCFFMNGERWVLSPLEKLTVYEGYDINATQIIKSYKPRVKSQLSTAIKSEIRPGILEQLKAFINKDDEILATFNQYQEFVSLISKISDS